MAFTRRKASYDIVELYEYAVRALGRQMRSVAELKKLLRRRAAGQEGAEALIEAVIDRLKEQKYLNDTQFATAYSSYRKENEKFGSRRVISDLKNKGVHSDLIQKAVRAAYSGVNEEQLAREFLRRKRIEKPSDARQAARIFRALARAGFTTRTIVFILKKWDVEDEIITTLETEAAE
jgi:regulatory protein